MSRSMRPWLTKAMSQIHTALDDIPDGIYIPPSNALPYTHADDVEMKPSLWGATRAGEWYACLWTRLTLILSLLAPSC